VEDQMVNSKLTVMAMVCFRVSSVHYHFEKINTTRDSIPLLITMTIVAQHPEVLLAAIGLFLFYVR
jgi:hypothetical protein